MCWYFSRSPAHITPRATERLNVTRAVPRQHTSRLANRNLLAIALDTLSAKYDPPKCCELRRSGFHESTGAAELWGKPLSRLCLYSQTASVPHHTSETARSLPEKNLRQRIISSTQKWPQHCYPHNGESTGNFCACTSVYSTLVHRRKGKTNTGAPSHAPLGSTSIVCCSLAYQASRRFVCLRPRSIKAT